MRNYTRSERALVYMGILAGKTLEEINESLEVDQKKLGVPLRLLPQSSFDMLRNRYLIHIGTPLKAWEHIKNPKSLSQLKEF